MGLRWHTMAVFWCGCCSLWPAWADDIYAYTSDDGTVYLSNVPTDESYQVLVAAPPAPAMPAESGPPQTAAAPSDKTQFDLLISKAAQTYGVDGALLHAVITVESKYNPKAVSHKGAIGMMQLMPKTGTQYGVSDLYDPAQNIDAGARYLRDLLALFKGDLNLTLAAYNAGEAAVAKYGNRIPPYRETSAYVPRVLNFYRKYRAGQVD